MVKKNDELLNSNYDGIQEYDNDLPKWWLILFYITIAFGGIYTVYYTWGPGLSSYQRLAQEMQAIQELHKSLPSAPKASDEDLIKITSDSVRLAKGKAVYDGKCMPCHGALGEGLVGPNLTDNHWIHGGKISQIKHVVENGVLEKGMLAWKGLISPDEIDEVTAYVFSLKGSNPPNAKAPEGKPE